MPEIDPRLGDYSFDEILKSVHHYMRVEIDKKQISKQISRNVSGEQNLLIRIIPLFIKRLFMSSIYQIIGSSQHSGVLTNLGRVKLPGSLKDKVEFFEFLPNPNPATVVNLGIICYADKLAISLASLSRQTDMEEIFITRLKQAGFQLKLISNRK